MSPDEELRQAEKVVAALRRINTSLRAVESATFRLEEVTKESSAAMNEFNLLLRRLEAGEL